MNKFWTKIVFGGWGISVLYVLLCLLFFSSIKAPHKLTYPLVLLTIASLRGRNRLLVLALAFSALGDFFGSIGELLPQIGAFGAAHIFYLLLLYKAARNTTHKLWHTVIALLIPLTLCIIAFASIIPHVHNQTIQIAVAVYAVVIGCMTFVAGLSESHLVRIGAILFMVSDFLLAEALFVRHLPNYLYLTPYFAGQMLLWIGLQKTNINPNS